MAGAQRKTLLGVGWSFAVVLVGCQLFTDANERRLVSSGETCRLASDCASGSTCLFGVCSPACLSDRDCDRGSICLKAATQAACVRPEQADCSRAPCPEGTQCVANRCRTVCDLTKLPCLDGQACVGSACIPGDDLVPDAGTGSFCVGGGENLFENDCVKTACQDQWETLVTNDREVPDDGDPCTADACFLGRPLHTVTPGLPCDQGSCDDRGQCGPCEPGRTQCQAGVRRTCDADGVYQQEPCPPAAPVCTGSGECIACPAVQTNHDCKIQVCDGSGNVTSVTDLSDAPVDGNPCTKDICSGATPSNPIEPDGTACPGGTCTSGTCSGPCSNGKQDGTETGVDCGGGTCPPCDDGAGCRVNADCAGGECNGATCGQPPITVTGNCFTVVVLRGGAVVESQSSPIVCEFDPRAVRTRSGDTTFVYSIDPPENRIHLSVSDPGRQYFGRCAPRVSTRGQLLAELNAEQGEDSFPEPEGASFSMIHYCPFAALYRW